jgi:hypothetical protein
MPVTFGAEPVPANLGKTETKGFELELSFRKRWASDWSFWLTANMSRARDKITQYEDPELMDDYLKTTGFTIGQTRTSLREDILTNWDDVYASSSWDVNEHKFIGDWGIVDFNNDGKINGFDAVPMDSQIAGHKILIQLHWALDIRISALWFSFMALRI